jgi:hypothetical protein
MPKRVPRVILECPECFNDEGYVVSVCGTAIIKKSKTYYNGISAPKPISLYVDKSKSARCSVCDFEGKPEDFVKK